MRSGSGYGSGFKSTVLTTEKMAVLAPMPSASAAIAVIVNPGVRRSIRSVCLRSPTNDSMSIRLRGSEYVASLYRRFANMRRANMAASEPTFQEHRRFRGGERSACAEMGLRLAVSYELLPAPVACLLISFIFFAISWGVGSATWVAIIHVF